MSKINEYEELYRYMLERVTNKINLLLNHKIRESERLSGCFYIKEKNSHDTTIIFKIHECIIEIDSDKTKLLRDDMNMLLDKVNNTLLEQERFMKLYGLLVGK